MSAVTIAYPIVAVIQAISTGLVPFIRNRGGSFYAMVAMVAGFLTNIVLDWLFVWVFSRGMMGAAVATVIGQGVTMVIALVYLIGKKQFTLSLSRKQAATVFGSIIKIGIAPSGLWHRNGLRFDWLRRHVWAAHDRWSAVLALILKKRVDGQKPRLQ